MEVKKLKIGYFADGPWSHLAFEKIIKDKRIEVAFIVPRFDTKDNKLKDYSEKYQIDYFKVKNVNNSEAIQKFMTYNCDLMVSMSFNQIFKEKILSLPSLGIINCHAGKLPFYRGRNILNWALINDEKEFGITVHFVDMGIDTGDIIMQRTFAIKENDNYSTLLDIAFVECANILYDTLILFIENNIKRKPQEVIHKIGMYCGKRGVGDEIIDWNQTSREIFNFIRAICYPGPSATTYMENKKVLINKSKYYPDAPVYKGKPGQILAKTEKGYLVKTLDSFIEIYDLEEKLIVGKRFSNGK